MTRKILLSTIASFAFLLIVNALLFPLLFPDGPAEKFLNMRENQLFQYHLVAFLILTFAMSVIYPIGYRGGVPWKEGLRFGCLLTLLVAVPNNLHVYAMVDLPFTKIMKPVPWILFTWGIAGIIIAQIHGRKADA